MKKLLISFLLCFTLVTVGTCSAFATDSYEPNNTPNSAKYITPGNAYTANLDAGDMDFYFFSQPTDGTQLVYFIPPDNQTYYVMVYDYHILNTSGTSASPLTFKAISNSQGVPVPLSFTRAANTAYWVLVFGSNSTTTGNYTLLPIGQ